MKFLVVFLLGLSVTAAIRLGYRQGKRYTYDYEGIIAHGIPEAFDNDMAIKIKAKAHVDFDNDGYIMMRLRDIALATIKGKLLDADRILQEQQQDEQQQQRQQQRQETPQTDVKERARKCLEKPVKFQVKANAVEKEIYAAKDDPNWCLNVKRAIVNHVYLPIQDNGEKYQTRQNEVTVAGKCRTAYTIVNRKPYYQVKRVIDFTQCASRPAIYQANIPNLDKFVAKRQGRRNAGELPHFLRSAAYMHYDLQGNADKGFIIRQVISESEHDFTMFGDEYKAGKAVAARTRQRLTLQKKEQPIPDADKAFPNAEKRRGLMYVHDNGAAATQTEEAQKNILAEVMTHIAAMKNQLETGEMTAEFAQAFTRLVSRLRYCTQKSLKMVCNECLTAKNEELKKVLLDAVARIGTPDAAKQIKELVSQGKLNAYLRRVLFGIGWVRNLNTDVMSQLKDICQHKNVASNREHQRTCWLSFGNLFNRLMLDIRKYPRLSQDTKLMELRDNFAKTLREALANAKDEERRITFVKAIGNAGWINTDVFKAVVDCIRNPKQPLHVILSCVWALRHMARVEPVQVRQRLFPFFANPLYDPELRMACYKILFQSDLSLLTCQKMASVIAREAAGKGPRSNQLVAFIASDLRTSIHLDKVDCTRASRARLLLRFIPRNVAFGLFSYSRAINVAFDTGAKATVEARFNKINGPQTFIPRHLNAKLNLHLPGLSANLLELGARIQGVHDILQPLFKPGKNRSTRSLDILNYIFGRVTHASEEDRDKAEFQNKLPARLASYFKIFGSEVYYGTLAEADLLQILRDALFGQSTANVAGITFRKTGIKYKQSFTNAHLFTEQSYIIPTLVGIPLKITSKVALAAKGTIDIDIEGKPQLLTTNNQNIDATIKVVPSVACHMHNKVGVWLPVVETAIIVKNQVKILPRMHVVISATQNSYTADFPTPPKDKQILDCRSNAHAVLRKELTPGVRQWQDIDLGMKMRGMVEIPRTCYGQNYFGSAACVQGKIADMAYIRTRRIPAFPYLLLNNLNVAFKHGEDNPAKYTAKFEVKKNEAKTYVAKAAISMAGAGKTRVIADYEANCDRTKRTCDCPWTFTDQELCGGACKGKTTVDYSTANRVTIRNEFKGNQFDTDVTIENGAKELHVVNTWNKLPKRIQRLVERYRPLIYALAYRYFGVEATNNKANKCEIRVKLHDKFTADIFANAPGMKLRRINQQLPITLEKFPGTTAEIKTMLRSHYGTCRVKGNNYIKTTDNLVIKQQIPGTCPYVLAEDARGADAKWRILLRLNEEGQQNVVIVIKGKRIELCQDMSVKIDGQKVAVEKEYKLPGVLRINKAGENKLFVQAEAGFQCLFDGTQAVAIFMPWWHNRIRGVCGNNDGEQWTDLITRCKTFAPDSLRREFIREWVVEGKNCQDKQCKLQARHVKLAQGAPAGKVCFTNGKFLQCMEKCEARKKQTVQAAYHCVDENSPLAGKITQRDHTIDLPNMSADVTAAVTEHLACDCKC